MTETMIEPPAPEAPTAKGDVTTVEPTRAQRSLARRVAEAKATIPDITLVTEVDMAAAAATGHDVEPLVIKACALALRDVPRANGSYRDAAFELYGRVNVGFTVMTDEALVVPTIFDADAKPLEAIAQERATLSERARGGAITSPEQAGGTFTVVDLGAGGALGGSAIIHGGQAGILAFGLVSRGRMLATLTCDHRILYGSEALAFLGAIRARLEAPAQLG
jgi:pyruvate dehydrogenase E2 component (dihydrolipoamide acetyltransferase)